MNNAGIAGRAAPLWELTDEDWNGVIAVNATGVFQFCRAVVPHMRQRSYGRIVNIASIAGKEGNPRMAPYSASKAAVIALTKSLGKELGDRGDLRQCGCSRGSSNPYLGATDSGAGDVYDRPDSDETHCETGGSRRCRSFPGEPRLLVCHGSML